jgi:hypothetical protein
MTMKKAGKIGVRHLRVAGCGLAIALAVTMVGGTADCADSLCIHFAGRHGLVRLKGGSDFSMSGMLPLTLCNLYPGTKYRFYHDGYGLEKRLGTFRLDGSGNPSVGGIRTGIGARNAILPGWGSMKSGRAWIGIDDVASIIASVGDLVIVHDEYRDRRDEYDALVRRLEEAETQGDIENLSWDVNAAAAMTNVQNKYQKWLLVFSAYIYGFQLIDPFLSVLPPRAGVEAGGSVVTMKPAERSRAKALLYSCVRPGRGQYYQGKTGRGVFDMIVDRFNASVLLEQKRQLQEMAAGQWDAVEDAKRNRNVSFIVFAGIWGLNVVDTLFPGEDGHVRESRYSLDWSPAGPMLVVRF